MKFVLINSDCEITGFDIFNNRITENFWYTVSEDAYTYCMAHNSQIYIKNIDNIKTRLAEFEANRDQYTKMEAKKIPILLTVDDLGYEKVHNLADVRIVKKMKHSILCSEAISQGIVYTIDGERKRFTYDTLDQLNFAEIEKFIGAGVFDENEIPIKASGDSEYSYINKDTFMEIYNLLRYNKYYNLFYLRVLNEYIDTINDPIVLEKMTFEVYLPKEFSTKLDTYLAPFKKYLKGERNNG